MKRILFVDDEPRVLDGLERMLRSERKRWDMCFAKTAKEALAALEASPCDVIVTDMRMPGMDGATLLEQVQDRFPGVVRIVLSGHVEMDAALRAAPVAHQFLTKPCDAERLRMAIERACDCSEMLDDETARRVVGAVGKLPALPATYSNLLETLRDPDVALVEIARIIEQDVGITAKVLQLVNSAFFGLRDEVTSVRMAVNCLGLETLKQLVLSAEIFRTFQPSAVRGFSLAEFEAHSRLAAQIAGRMPAPPSIITTAVVAALLHDIGKLVLAARLPLRFELALEVAHKEGVPLHTVEKDQTGTTHAQVGAYLLDLWGLPQPIVQAVLLHHHPMAQPPGRWLNVLGVTHIANALAIELSRDPKTRGESEPGMLDMDYLALLGMSDQLPAWRACARRVIEGQG